MIRVADYIVDRLVENGLKHFFMVTGRGILYLSDAVARKENLHGISMHHEQSASYAALAYAAYNGKIGGCLVSTGCAATNAVTGVLCAWQDAIPCVFISGQNMLKETVRYAGTPIRTYGQQETDIIEIVKPITKYAVMLTRAEEVAIEIDKAIYYAQTGRKGPVWIDVPLDIQNARIDPEQLKRYVPVKKHDYMPIFEDILFVSKELQMAKRPVILIGSGIRASDAIDKLYSFLEKHPLPIVFDSAAVDIYGLDNPYSIGVIGSPGGTRAGNFTVQNADLILAIGCRMSPMTTGPEYHKFAREAKIIVVDIDKDEHTKNTIKIDKLIIADALLFLEVLDKVLSNLDIKDWINTCVHWKKIFPKCEEKYKKSELVDLYYLSECLSSLLTDHTVFLCDAGIEELICPAAISFRKEQRCIHPVSQGAMGFALPAAIGAYYASGNEIVTVIGDGSIMMNLQELQTIYQNNIPIKIIITNNNCYAVIRKRQREMFRNRTIGTDKKNGISCPDFEEISKAFHISYRKISNSAHLLSELKQFLQIEGPSICEIMCVEKQEYISNGYARTKSKRFAQRPIEDQAPFMDRELFLSEMIVEPIDI